VLAVLVTAASLASTPGEAVAIWTVRAQCEQAGYTQIAITLALRGLLKKGLVGEAQLESSSEFDSVNGIYVKDLGLDWLESHIDRFVLKRTDVPVDDGLPF